MSGEFKTITHSCEVLVVGGGNAGINAAISARQEGASVIVMEKADPARSGSIGGGVDHFMAYLETGPEWDTREGYLDFVGRVAHGAVNLKVHDALFCKGGRDEMIERFDHVGSTLRQPDGSFYRTQSYGQPGPYWINFNGKHLKLNLYREAHRLGAKMLSHVVVTGLLKDGERVAGAVGFHSYTGDFHVVQANTVVLSTGNTNRIYLNPTPYRFNTWQCPADTGAAQVYGLEIGATLANMEYMRWTVVPKGFSAAGLNALTGMGGKFINARGEEFLSRYHPLADRAPRSVLVDAVYTEIKEGRGPVCIDCRHLPPEDLSHLRDLLGWDKDTLPDFLMQKSVDLTKEPLEVMFSEGMQAGPAEVCGSGLLIDEHCATTVPGLYAAGDCADQTRCLSLSAAGGSMAGHQAGREAPGLGRPSIDPEQLAELKERTYRPLQQRSGSKYIEVEDSIAEIMWRYVGPLRDESGLKRGQVELESLADEVANLAAADLHELMRCHEVATMWTVCQVSAAASLERRETRFGPYFKRADYPEKNDAQFCGQMLVEKRGKSFSVSYRPLSYEIPA